MDVRGCTHRGVSVEAAVPGRAVLGEVAAVLGGGGKGGVAGGGGQHHEERHAFRLEGLQKLPTSSGLEVKKEFPMKVREGHINAFLSKRQCQHLIPALCLFNPYAAGGLFR